MLAHHQVLAFLFPVLLWLVKPTSAHHEHSESAQVPFSNPGEEYSSKYGPQIDLPFTGPLSFAHLPYTRCLDDPSTLFDIAVLGLPFDTAVSYRPGARFGPHGIRTGSRRLRHQRGYSLAWETSPYDGNATKVLDCGDVSVLGASERAFNLNYAKTA